MWRMGKRLQSKGFGFSLSAQCESDLHQRTGAGHSLAIAARNECKSN